MHDGRRRTLYLLGGLGLAVSLGGIPPAARAGSYDDWFQAVRIDNADEVKELLAAGFDPNTVEEQRGDTGLILALRENCMKVVRVLVDAPGIDLGHKIRNGDTAVMIAAYKGNPEAVKWLLDRGAEINRPGWTALHYGAASGSTEVVALLLDHAAYIDAESPNKTTPLMMAAWNGRQDVVFQLLDEGADGTLRNTVGMSAADFARKSGLDELADAIEQYVRDNPKR